MAFNVPIKIDDGDSGARIDRFESKLAKAEATSDRVSKTLDRLGRNFQGLGAAMEARARSSEIHARLNNNLASSFDRLGQAIQREQTMLVSIRGDMQRHMQDVQTLDALLKRGAITANEYAAAVARSRASAGLGDPRNAVSLPNASTRPGLGSALGGQLASMASGTAAASLVSSAFIQEMDKIGAHERTLDAAANSLLRYHSNMKEAREALADHVAMSRELGVSVREQIAAFDGVEGAMSSMATTKRQLMDITRNLSMVMISEDKSIENVARVMETMEFAMQRGSLEMRDVRTIMKEFPPIAEMWSKALGRSQAEILEMAKSGELGRREIMQMITAFEDGGDVAKTFGERNLDVKKVMDDQGVSFFEAYHMVEQWKESIGDVQPLDDFERKLRDINARINNVSASMADFDRKMSDVTRRQVQALADEGIFKPLEKLAETLKKQEEAARRAAQAQREWNEEIAQLAKLEPALRNIGDSLGKLPMGFARSQTSFADVKAQPDPFAGRFQVDIDENKLAQDIERANAQLPAFERNWQSLSDTMEQGTLRQVERLGDELANLFMTGEFGWRQMIDAMIKDMTRLAIQQAVLLGFKTAFPSLGGSAGLDFKVQGFSAGGAPRVDTDSVFLGMRVSPNERIIVQTPGQQMRDREAATSSPAPQPVVPVTVVLDERAILRAFQSPMGATVLHDLFRKNPGLKR